MQNLFIIATADRGEQDKMPHNMAFHQGLHCLLRQNDLQRKTLQFYLEIVTCDNGPFQVYCINPEGRIH